MSEHRSERKFRLISTPPWGRNFGRLQDYLGVLAKRYGRLPYPEELRNSTRPSERAFFYALEQNRIDKKIPSLDLLPTFAKVQALEAENDYRANHADLTRGKLAAIAPAVYRRLWRHRSKGALETVPVREQSPWGNNAWEYYLREPGLVGLSIGEVNSISNGLYKALRRQTLPAGTVLPDGKVLDVSARAADCLPRHRKSRMHRAN